MAIGRMEYLRNVLGAAFSVGGITGGLYAIGQRLAEDSGKLALPAYAVVGLAAGTVAAGVYTAYELYRTLHENHNP